MELFKLPLRMAQNICLKMDKIISSILGKWLYTHDNDQIINYTYAISNKQLFVNLWLLNVVLFVVVLMTRYNMADTCFYEVDEIIDRSDMFIDGNTSNVYAWGKLAYVPYDNEVWKDFILIQMYHNEHLE